MQESQRVSTESSSSRASFSSSSRSSSLSSLLEQGSSVKTIFSETLSAEACNGLSNKSWQVGRQSLDLQEFVKNSIYWEVQNLSTEDKTTKVSDSDTFLVSDVDMKQGTRADVMNSLEEAARNRINEHRKLFRSSTAISYNAPRFSYEGREINRASFDSRYGFNPTSKFQDFPKLSPACRETDRNSKSTENDCVKFNDDIQSTQGNQSRVPSVVAKLMGLETLPDSDLSSETNLGSTMSYKDKDLVRISSSFQLSSAKNLWKERNSPHWKIHDGSTKPMSVFPIEPAPWKNIDKARSQQKMASRSDNGSMKVPYSEIEKRLKALEILVSGKDFGAVKQMMEAERVNGLPENAKLGQDSNLRIHKDSEQQQLEGSVRSIESPKSCSDQVVSLKKDNNGSSTNDDSPIVIAKPAKPVNGLNESPIDNRNCSSSGTTDKEPNLGNGKRVLTINYVRTKHEQATKTSQCSMRQQQMSNDGNTGPGKSSGSIVSQRMQQKKLDIEKRSRPPTPLNSIKSKTQSNKKQSEPKSSIGRRLKNHNFQITDDQLSESSVGSSNSSNRETRDTAQSGESFVRCSGNGSTINSRGSSSTSSFQSPCLDASESMPSGSVKKKLNLTLMEEESAEHVAYSSPVSVLDSINKYKDSSSSPKQYARKITRGTSKSKDGNSDLAQQSSENSFVSTSSESGSMFKINRKKLKDIDSLVQKLRNLNTDHDETRVDYIASLCENGNPDHRYVSEILLASGLLLRDFTSSATDYQFHTSGYPLNPELFSVLERTKASSSSNQECPSKKTGHEVHRKLIFDTVNEILARKLSVTCPCSDPWSRPMKLTRSSLNAQKLLRDVCSEIEGLRNKNSKCSSKEEDAKWKTILFDDVMLHSESWINFDVEISGAVLDIERLIFKDLVKEIVLGGDW